MEADRRAHQRASLLARRSAGQTARVVARWNHLHRADLQEGGEAKKLFKSSLEGNVRRAIDFHEDNNTHG